jgi:intracellular sulfur oxidation DsrE/DsrF family protein
MKLLRQTVFAIFACLACAVTPALAEQAGDGTKRLAIQISDNDPATFNKALNVATNFARGMSEAGEFYEIEIVTFNAGLHMLRTDTSPVLERIESISASIPEVTFSACGNTIAGMTKKEGSAPPITEHAGVVTAGVVRLMELDDEGYFVIRP